MSDPVFDLLDRMIQDVPDRPTQPPHIDPESIPFDAFDDDLMHDVLGNDRLAKPVQALLILLWEIEATKGSFGTDDGALARAVLPKLIALREACRDEWRDQ
jgi:hypothetical protein